MKYWRRLLAAKDHWFGILGSTTFWCLLWGGFTPLTVVGGVLVALVIHMLFPLPPLGRELAFRPWHALRFVLAFVRDLTVSSAQVASYALRPSGSPGSSVIAVQLKSQSDLFLTFTGIMATLIPGSVVVEAQRSTGTLFFHVIGAVTEAGCDEMRESILAQERRALLAFGARRVLDGAGISLKEGDQS